MLVYTLVGLPACNLLLSERDDQQRVPQQYGNKPDTSMRHKQSHCSAGEIEPVDQANASANLPSGYDCKLSGSQDDQATASKLLIILPGRAIASQ